MALRLPFSRIVPALSILLVSGCRTPIPPGEAQTGCRIGPFFERAYNGDGASLTAFRPFYSREEYPGSSQTDVFWPLSSFTGDADRHRWRAALAYGMGDDDDGTCRLRIFPLLFAGKTRDGGKYGALFPLGGTIRNFLVFDRVSFFLFPLYAEGETAGIKMRSWMWPVFLTRTGDGFSQFRLWPFYGKTERQTRRGKESDSFVLWPVWSKKELSGQIEGSGFVLFPIYGRSAFTRHGRGREESWSVLPPLFHYGRGDDGYLKLHAPWPFFRLEERNGYHALHLWPLWGRRARADLETEYFLWPFFRQTRSANAAQEERLTHAPMPFFFRKVVHRGGEEESGAPKRGYSRLWPLYSHRYDDEGERFIRFPELSLWSSNSHIERNWAPLWSFYTYRQTKKGGYCHDLLWGLFSCGRSDAGSRIFSLFWIPFAR